MKKNILVVCEQFNIDTSLRRSLAHLVNSCEVTVATNGYQAFDELRNQTFNLIITDSEITGIDGLELAESIAYIDPGVPVILMLPQDHKVLWGAARRLNANPILRPFKPLTFLRLIDTLLHEHLERYRELAETLKSILQGLSVPTQALLAFLIDGSGQPLIATDDVDQQLLENLSGVATNQIYSNGRRRPLTDQQKTLLVSTPDKADHQLYLTSITENLHLGLIFSTTTAHLTPDDIWQWMTSTVKGVKTAFYQIVKDEASTSEERVIFEADSNAGQPQILIPLKLDTALMLEPDVQQTPIVTSEPETPQQIVPETPVLLNRLQAFCQIN